MAAFINAAGETQQVEVNMDMVREASASAQSLRDYVNSNFDTDAKVHGDAFSQLCASEGIILVPQRQFGMRAPSLANALTRLEAGAIVRTPNSQARVLLMPAIGALVEDKLVANMEMHSNAFDAMLALDTTIADDWLLWPEANYDKPEAARSQVTSQLAKPTAMLTLTTSEKQIRIPTVAMGIQWSDQSAKYLNLDFIALSIARQVAVERNEKAKANLYAMYAGDADVAQGSLASLSKVKNADTFDSTISANGALTETAWVKWLNTNSSKRRITHCVTDVDGFLAIQNRSGKPTVQTDNPNSPRLTAEAGVMNMMFGNVMVFITDDPNWPANTIMGIDKDYAIQRITSTNATYEAQEQFVIERKSVMRFDYGTLSRRLYADAFEVLALINT